MSAMADNVLSIVIKQTEGDKTLSELSLTYPAMPNAEANAFSLELVDAISALVRSAAAAKAEAGGAAKGLVDFLKRGKAWK